MDWNFTAYTRIIRCLLLLVSINEFTKLKLTFELS